MAGQVDLLRVCAADFDELAFGHQRCVSLCLGERSGGSSLDEQRNLPRVDVCASWAKHGPSQQLIDDV